MSSIAVSENSAAISTDSIVVQWNSATLQAIRDIHPGPPMVARQLAIVHTCIYDAWTSYDQSAVSTRLAGFLRRPTSEQNDDNKKEAISFAAYRALVDLFPLPAQKASFDALMTSLGYDPADESLDPATPSGVGNLMSRAVLSFRHGDGSNQLGDLHPGVYSDYTGYAPQNDPDHINNPNRWQPLRVSNGMGGSVTQAYIAPQWGLVTPSPLSSGGPIQFGSPATYPSARYTHQAKRILRYSAELTDRQKVIAEYWADGPSSELPPGHWCLFGQFVSHRDGHNIDDDAKMFFALTNAIFDASVQCWGIKREFDSVRPVTAIHYLFAGQQVLAWAGPGLGTRLIDGASWRPYQAPTVVTPPFPEYSSGHSTFSAAGAEILGRFSGSDAFGDSFTQPAGSSLVEPGAVPATDVTLSWATFSDAADEAGISRRFGGIHFVDGDLSGRRAGRRIGKRAWQNAQKYFNGTAS